MRPEQFGTEEFPLHPSGLQNLIVCPWREVLAMLTTGDESGAAADTGSAMHKAAHALHSGKSVAESIGVMQAEKHSYPQADLTDAAGLFLAYAAHPETQTAKVVLAEQKIRFQIAPSAQDPTGAPISIEGTLDQVREVGGQLYLWDIKTTKKHPLTALRNSQHQAAAYCIGASYLLGRPVLPGGLIMPRQTALYIPFAWKWDDIEDILAPVRDAVALIRSGTIHHVSHAATCEWCPAGGPELCLPRKRRYLKSLL